MIPIVHQQFNYYRLSSREALVSFYSPSNPWMLRFHLSSMLKSPRYLRNWRENIRVIFLNIETIIQDTLSSELVIGLFWLDFVSDYLINELWFPPIVTGLNFHTLCDTMERKIIVCQKKNHSCSFYFIILIFRWYAFSKIHR